MVIRPLTVALVDEAVALWDQAGLARPWNDPHADLRRALAGSASTVLAATDDHGALLGTVMVGDDGHRAWVSYLAVAPEAEQSAVGRALMAAAEAWAQERSIPTVHLMLRTENTRAAGFYSALGYEKQDVTVWGRRLPLTSTAARHQPSSTLRLMVLWAAIAAVLVQVPRLLGVPLGEEGGLTEVNLGIIALAPLAGFVLTAQRAHLRLMAGVAAVFVAMAVVVNVSGLRPGSDVSLLLLLHVPMVLWLAIGVAQANDQWRDVQARIAFLRFTGDWFVQYVLIALGGGVFAALFIGAFSALGWGAEDFVTTWVIPSGAMAAVVVVGWLVNAPTNPVAGVTPALARIFTPLFAVALVALLGGVAIRGQGLDRDLLLNLNLLLLVVVGLLIYGLAVSSSTGRWLWVTQTCLATTTLLVDLWVLGVLGLRIGDFGFSANKTAALGVNLILATNLAGSTWLLVRTGAVAGADQRLATWQARLLPVYGCWASCVVLLFPLVF